MGVDIKGNFYFFFGIFLLFNSKIGKIFSFRRCLYFWYKREGKEILILIIRGGILEEVIFERGLELKILYNGDYDVCGFIIYKWILFRT